MIDSCEMRYINTPTRVERLLGCQLFTRKGITFANCVNCPLSVTFLCVMRVRVSSFFNRSIIKFYDPTTTANITVLAVATSLPFYS
jgi:hypothetical protein